MDYLRLIKKPITEQKKPEPINPPETLAFPPRPKEASCQSVQYSEEGLISCGSGDWFCDRCRGAGNGLKTVYFWSDSLRTILDLMLPEKDLYDYKKIMEARSRREEKGKINE